MLKHLLCICEDLGFNLACSQKKQTTIKGGLSYSVCVCLTHVTYISMPLYVCIHIYVCVCVHISTGVQKYLLDEWTDSVHKYNITGPPALFPRTRDKPIVLPPHLSFLPSCLVKILSQLLSQTLPGWTPALGEHHVEYLLSCAATLRKFCRTAESHLGFSQGTITQFYIRKKKYMCTVLRDAKPKP